MCFGCFQHGGHTGSRLTTRHTLHPRVGFLFSSLFCGNVVNVPADVINTVNLLPRLPEQIGTIKVQLKLRLQYNSSALSLNIRPHKVLQAANWLASTSTLYQEQGIAFNPNWEINSNQNNELNEQIDDVREATDSQN